MLVSGAILVFGQKRDVSKLTIPQKRHAVVTIEMQKLVATPPKLKPSRAAACGPEGATT